MLSWYFKTNLLSRILIGLVAALVAVCLLLLGLRFLGAKKR